MRIETTRFGEIEVPETDFILLPEGILGFPDSTRYVLLEHDSEGTPFKWLQSLDDANLAFIVMDPRLLVERYEIEEDTDVAAKLGSGNTAENTALMAIVNVPPDRPIEMTANVRAPIVVDAEKRTGWQIVLSNDSYPVRHRIFADPQEESANAQAGQTRDAETTATQ